MKIIEFFKDISSLAQLILVIITIVYLWQMLLWVSIGWIVALAISLICELIKLIKGGE
jgi:hypothetical protein